MDLNMEKKKVLKMPTFNNENTDKWFHGYSGELIQIFQPQSKQINKNRHTKKTWGKIKHG